MCLRASNVCLSRTIQYIEKCGFGGILICGMLCVECATRRTLELVNAYEKKNNITCCAHLYALRGDVCRCRSKSDEYSPKCPGISRHAGECSLRLRHQLRRRSVRPKCASRRPHAIATVQNAMEKWGKFIIVYEPRQADIVMMVMSHPSEDVLAIYDARGWPGNGQYLWRMMGRDGLQASEAPLVTNLEKAFDLATAARK